MAHAHPDLDIRELRTTEEMVAASAVFEAVWGSPDGGMPPNLLRALQHSGNYVVGVYDGAQMMQ